MFTKGKKPSDQNLNKKKDVTLIRGVSENFNTIKYSSQRRERPDDSLSSNVSQDSSMKHQARPINLKIKKSGTNKDIKIVQANYLWSVKNTAR
jgi:hypothetical protein